MVDHRVHWLDPVFKALSTIGSGGLVFLAIALGAAFVLRRPWLFVLVAAADGAADLLSYGIKDWVGRPRPHYHPLVAVPHSGSFPSGHTITAFACATALALLVRRLAPLVLVLAVAVGYSRVYLGVHYPFDVIGGAALGVFVATALVLLAKGRLRSVRRLRPG